MSPSRTFRWAHDDDHEVLAEVMFDAVRNGESPYNEQQRAAWVPLARRGQEWTDRLRSQDIVIAEVSGNILGFMSLATGGYIDFAFIRPDARHTGLFRQLFERVVEKARFNGETLLWVHASLMAEPAFTKVGFAITERQQVVIGEEKFERFEMHRAL